MRLVQCVGLLVVVVVVVVGLGTERSLLTATYYALTCSLIHYHCCH